MYDNPMNVKYCFSPTANWQQEIGYVFERNAENVLFPNGKYFRKKEVLVDIEWMNFRKRDSRWCSTSEMLTLIEARNEEN